MKHDEIATILNRQVREFDLRMEKKDCDKPRQPSSNKARENLPAYEDIQNPRKGSSAKGNLSSSGVSSPQLPPRDRPGIPGNKSQNSKSPLLRHRSPKPLPRSTVGVQKMTKSESLPGCSEQSKSDETNMYDKPIVGVQKTPKSGSLPGFSEQSKTGKTNVYEKPTGPQRRESFLYGSGRSPVNYGTSNSSAKVKEILGVGTLTKEGKFREANKLYDSPCPSVPDRDRSRSLPLNSGDNDSDSEGYINSDPESARGSSDVESAKCEVDQIRRRKDQYVLGEDPDSASSRQKVNEKRKLFEATDTSASALQDMHTRLFNMSKAAQAGGVKMSKAVESGGAKMKEAANNVIAQLKGRFSGIYAN